jgi:hypothetical protein
MKKKYVEDPAKNQNEVFIKIAKIWSEIPKSFIQKLVDSIYNRLAEMIRQKGGQTDY